MSIMDVFGRGAMPQFNMRGAGTSTPFRDLGTEALRTQAAGEELRALQEEKFSSDMGKISDGLDYLKDLMSPEDQEEELLEDLPLEAIIPMMGPSGDDEATGKFESGQTFTEDLTQSAADFLDLNQEGREILGNAIEAPKEGIDFFVDEFESGYNPEERNSALAITGEAYRAAEPYIKDALKGTSNFFIDQYNKYKNTPIENYEYETDFYQDLFGDKTREEEINSIPIYADGGRVGLNTGGMPFGYTPFMNMQQGIDYYSQFANPTFGNAAVEESQQQDQSSVADDVLGQEENLGTLIDPRGGRGPEDRGSFADRFGTAEDQGYGYSGTPGEGGSATFNNPAYGSSLLGTGTGDTFTPAPGIGMAYDEYGRLRNIGVLNDLGLNLYDAAYPIAKMKPGIPGIFENIFNANKNYQEKKAQEERDALAQQVKDDAIALSTDIKDRFASYNVGGGNEKNKPSAGTGTFSEGKVSGFTGQGQSPHSSMSTAGKNKNKNKNTNKGVGGGAGPKGGSGKPGDGNKGPRGRSRCFVKGTMLEMADGTTKEITTITPGMETRGGTVEFVLQGLPVDIWDYKGVKVSGTHWVVEDNQLIAVEDSKHGIKTDMFEPVYSMKTSKQRMWVNGIEFGDFESGTDEDWEPYFEKVRQDLNKKLREKRKENQQSDERV